jgi:hypothetical protein
VTIPTIFVHTGTARTLGDGSFDAFVFWPRTRIVGGRPDWLATVLGRKRFTIPSELVTGSGVRLVQAFRPGEPPTAIPVDQLLLDERRQSSDLMLPVGNYWLRTISRAGEVLAEATVTVR